MRSLSLLTGVLMVAALVGIHAQPEQPRFENFQVSMKIQPVAQYVHETQTASGGVMKFEAVFNGTHMYLVEQTTSAQVWARVRVTGADPAHPSMRSFYWEVRQQFQRIPHANAYPQDVCRGRNSTYPTQTQYSNVTEWQLLQFGTSQIEDNFVFALKAVFSLNNTWQWAGNQGKDNKGKTLSLWRNWQYNGPSTNGYVGPVSKLVTASPNGVPVSLYSNQYTAPLRIDLTGFAKGKATPLLATLFKQAPAVEECAWPSELAGGPVTPSSRRRRRMQEENPDDITVTQEDVEEDAHNKGVEFDESLQVTVSGQLENAYPNLYGFVSNVTAEDLPDSFDLRAEGHMFTIRSQLNCAACYAFAMVASAESVMYRTSDNLMALSPQAVVDCVAPQSADKSRPANLEEMATNGGCAGSTMLWTLEGILANGGFPLEEAYPYTGVNGPCRSSPILNETDSPQPVFKPDGYFWLVGDFEAVGTPEAANTTIIKQALVQYGAVMALVYAGPEWSAYTSGVLNSTTCAQKDPSLYPPNHAVTIIGWEGDNWIVANQWSEYWGMYGTVLLPMDNDCWAATHQPLVFFRKSQLPPGTELVPLGTEDDDDEEEGAGIV